MFVVCVNTPGYLPESDPDVVETWEEALQLADDILNRETMDIDKSVRSLEIDVVREDNVYASYYIYDTAKDYDLGRVIEVTRYY